MRIKHNEFLLALCLPVLALGGSVLVAEAIVRLTRRFAPEIAEAAPVVAATETPADETQTPLVITGEMQAAIEAGVICKLKGHWWEIKPEDCISITIKNNEDMDKGYVQFYPPPVWHTCRLCGKRELREMENFALPPGEWIVSPGGRKEPGRFVPAETTNQTEE